MYRISYFCRFYDYDGSLIANYLTVKNYTRRYGYSTLKHRLYNCFTKASKMLEQLRISKYDWKLTVIEQNYAEESGEILFERTIINYHMREDWGME